MCKKYLLIVLSAVSIVGLAAPITVFAASKDKPAATEKAGPQHSTTKKISDALQSALTAIEQKKFDVAIEKIKSAESVAKPTDYDQFQINEMKAYLYSKQDTNPNDVLRLYEQSLQTPDFFKDKGYSSRFRQLVGVTFRMNLYAKTIEYAKRSLEIEPNDKTIQDVLGQVQFAQKQYAESRQTLQALIDSAEAKGAKPDLIWLQMVQRSAKELDDNDGVVQMYEKMIVYYPKDEYWRTLLTYNLRLEKSGQTKLNLCRLLSSLNLFAEKVDYADYAQLALDYGLPNESLSALQSGIDKKLPDADAAEKAHYESLLVKVKQAAVIEKAQLASYEKDAANSTADGRAAAGLGLAYFSFDMLDKAIESLDKGLQKGGLKDPDNYRITLGIALFRHGDVERARAEFDKLIASKSKQANAAKLWLLRTRS